MPYLEPSGSKTAQLFVFLGIGVGYLSSWTQKIGGIGVGPFSAGTGLIVLPTPKDFTSGQLNTLKSLTCTELAVLSNDVS
jgi:hypothetical protein